MTADKSRMQLAKFALVMDHGQYFKKNGKMDSNLGLDYLKSDKWEIDPFKKGKVPADSNYVVRTRTYPDEFYSIDGEKYPCQKILATVINK
jgi:hypothetical protein